MGEVGYYVVHEAVVNGVWRVPVPGPDVVKVLLAYKVRLLLWLSPKSAS